MQAVRLLGQGKTAAAAGLRDRAFESAPATPGKIDGKPFAWLADADTRLGPVIELHMEGKYYWVPVRRVRRIALEPPANLIDLVFAPARFVWANGGEGAGFIPVRYQPSGETGAQPDPKCLLSRLTQWRELPDGFTVGSGQRMFATDAEEIPLLDCRVIDLQPA
jgi:type VI secretion system protein ImpE